MDHQQCKQIRLDDVIKTSAWNLKKLQKQENEREEQEIADYLIEFITQEYLSTRIIESVSENSHCFGIVVNMDKERKYRIPLNDKLNYRRILEVSLGRGNKSVIDVIRKYLSKEEFYVYGQYEFPVYTRDNNRFVIYISWSYMKYFNIYWHNILPYCLCCILPEHI
jgi:hypothetical protein